MAGKDQFGESLSDARAVFLSQLIGALRKGRLDPTSEDVADILWLAACQAKPSSVTEPGGKPPLSSRPEEGLEEGDQGPEGEQRSEVGTEDRGQGKRQNDGKAAVYPRGSTGKGRIRHGTPIRIPGGRALPGTIEIARALRPLMRRVPSRQFEVFDEKETARRIAEDGLWMPAFRPASERWLSLALLIDDSPSMQIWQRTVEEFKTLLSGLGAFQDVRSWSLATSDPETVTISTASGLPGRSTQELLDPAGRRLLLVVTDCVAPTWRSAAMRELLGTWASSQPVALVQLLPQRLWSRTGLACASLVRVRAPEAGVGSSRLKLAMIRARRRRQSEIRLPIPITTLEPAFLAPWARLVGGAAVVAPAAILYPEAVTTPSAQDRSAEERLRIFRSSASPLGFRLACLLAAAPLSLTVMRMIQTVMLPHSRQSHLAEFFLSGLLRRRRDVSDYGHDEVFYDFATGIRELLLDAGELPDAVQVQRILSQYIETHYGRTLDFQAVLNDPEGVVLGPSEVMNQHFTTISAMVLKRLGGAYARVAEQIVATHSTDTHRDIIDSTKTATTIATKGRIAKRRTKKRTRTKWVPEEGDQQLERHLWSALDIIRDSNYSSDYKSYIFGLLFLKRLSDRFDEECDALINKGLDPEDRDEHRFFVPKQARWSHLMKASKNLGETINKALSALENENSELEGVLAWIDFNKEWRLGDLRQWDTTLQRLVQHFSEFDIKDSSLPEPGMLGRACEDLIEKFADNAGKKGGDFYTPYMVARLIAEILDPEEGMRVCDPTCGSGSMLLQCAEHLARKGKDPRNLSLFGQERNLSTWAICKMNMLLHERVDARIEKGDTIRDPKLLEGGELMLFDRVVANPPFSLDRWGHETAEADPFRRFRFGVPPKTRGDLAFVQHMVAVLNGHGKLGVVISHGVLFRGSSEGRIRQGLIEEDLVEAVVGLPSGLFYGTRIPAAVLVVNRDKSEERKGKVLFVDASLGFRKGRVQNSLRDEDVEKIAGTIRAFQNIERYAQVVGIEEIRRDGFNLTISKYTATEYAYIPILLIEVISFTPAYERVEHKRALLRDFQELLAATARFYMPHGDPWKKWDRHGTGDGYYLLFDDLGPAVAAEYARRLGEALADFNAAHPDVPIRLRQALTVGDVEWVGDQILSQAFADAERLISHPPFKELALASPRLSVIAISDLFHHELSRDGKHDDFPDLSVLSWTLFTAVDKHGKKHDYFVATDPPPEPAYPNDTVRDLSKRLDDAYRRLEETQIAEGDTTAIRDEILELRRGLREGGQFHAGDFLLDGRFRLIQEIGRGGFATVWKAFDRTSRDVVAVKVLHGQYARDETRRERFLRGARQMARLHHQGIVRVIEERCEDGGFLFFVMEHLPGGDLRQAVLDGRFDREGVLRIVREVGEALAFAHTRHVIHRDVKPGNVLLDAEGHAKLTDFDLVRAVDTTGGTRTGMMGTVVYAAPELLHKAQKADARADVYGLGMTAIFALAGEDLPLDVLRDAEPFVASLELDDARRAALLRAVEWKAEERFSSVPEFCGALEGGSTPTILKGTDGTTVTRRSVARISRKRRRTAAESPPEELFQWIETPLDGRVALWRDIPAGEFLLGSPEGVGHDDERPRHRVVVKSGFRMGAVTVTNAQYAAFDPEKANMKQPNHPVVNVSWYDAMELCRWLASEFPWAEGARLPTEEEWEYACRAGTETLYWSGDEEPDLNRVGWYSANSGDQTHSVGEKPANPWGLYDIHGNIWEWTASIYDNNKYEKRPKSPPFPVDSAEVPADLTLDSLNVGRVFRGGSFRFNSSGARAACRDFRPSRLDFTDLGFRVLLPPVPR